MSVHDVVPTFENLQNIYTSSAVQQERSRWEHLVHAYTTSFGHAPSHIVRAPGRVNVLGEHVDYSLFPVLPAAIQHDVLFAIRAVPSEGRPSVSLENVQSRFKPCSFALVRSDGGWDVDLQAGPAGWGCYMKAVVKEGLARYFSDESEPVSLQIMVSGNVPPGSGLSSSAAFVVAAVLSFLIANGISEHVNKDDLVKLAIASEHRMGLQTGGMDQAASVLGLESSLLHISFFPELAACPIPISSQLAIVITNSMVPHSLTDSAPKQYNLRVVESLIAARLLLHAWGLSDLRPAGRIWLKEVLSLRYGQEVPSYETLLSQVEEILGSDGKGDRGWTREEMIDKSGLSSKEFTRLYLDFLQVRADSFHLLRRTRHILGESERVEQFCQLSRNNSPLTELGHLLVQSHDSCRTDYDCTHPQTDLLQSICMDLGALGSRQTGGGWGGAVISLVPVDQAAVFLDAVKTSYEPYQALDEVELDSNAFITKPGVGAGVYNVTGHVM